MNNLVLILESILHLILSNKKYINNKANLKDSYKSDLYLDVQVNLGS
jgi:hypothetical protein